MEGEREPLPSRVEDPAPLPARYHEALERGLGELSGDAGSPGVLVAPDAREVIDGHMRLLLAWTTAINLTAIRDAEAAATAHVLDSLTAAAPLRARGVTRLLDLGSGGGIPGIPLAIALPAAEVLLVESIGKKARFLATVVDAIGAAGTIHVAATRAEALAADPHQRGRWQVVTARAVAALAELVELGLPLVEPGGAVVAWKRGDIEAELDAATVALEALGGGSLEIVEVGALPALHGHRLVIATRTGRVPATYPRDPAERARRPWR